MDENDGGEFVPFLNANPDLRERGVMALERIAGALERAYPVPPKTPVGAKVKGEIREFMTMHNMQRPNFWDVTADEMAAIRLENPGLKPDSKISFLGVPLRVKPDV